MQHQEEYPPLPSHASQHHDNKPATHARGQPASREAMPSGAPLPPHMAQSIPHYQHQQQQQQQPRLRSYQRPPRGAAPLEESMPLAPVDPLPPHLHHMVPPHIRGGAAPQAAPARPTSVPEHLQPRPFPQQRDTSSPRQQQPQQDQAPGLQPQQQQQAPAGYRPAAAGGVSSAPDPAGGGRPAVPPLAHGGSSGGIPQGMPSPSSARPAQAAAAAAAYQAPANYDHGKGGSAVVAAPEPLVDDGGQLPGWYHTAPGHQPQHQAQPAPTTHYAPAQQQQGQRRGSQQQHLYDNADFPQGAPYTVTHQHSGPHQQAAQQQQQQRQQYSPPSSQPQQSTAHQYQQHPYQQQQQQQLHGRPVLSGDDGAGPVPRASSGQVPLPTGPSAGPPTSNGTLHVTASAGLQYAPQPPIQLKPAVDVTATPVSFVQLVQQPGGIQVDQSGALRVPTAAVDTAAAAAPGVPPMQAAAPSQHTPVAPYVQQMPPSAAVTTDPQLLPPHMVREAQPAPQELYDAPVYQPPVGMHGGGGGMLREDPAGGHRQSGGYLPEAHSLRGADDGRMYGSMQAMEPQGPPQHQPLQHHQPMAPPPPVSQDSGYPYPDNPLGRYSGAAAGGADRHGSRGDLIPDVPDSGKAPDAYMASPGPRRGGMEHYGPRGDVVGLGEPPHRVSAADGGRGAVMAPPRQGSATAVPDRPALPLAEVLKRGRDFVEAVKATRRVGDLMADMLPRLLDKCQNEIHELSRSLESAATDAAQARGAADAAAAAVAKAEADSAEAAVRDDQIEDLSKLSPPHVAFIVERCIRAVWPLDTAEHELYRTVAGVLLLEEGGKVVPVNNEEVELLPNQMVGATLCNVQVVQDKVGEVKAAGGGSTMMMLRQVPEYFEVREHTHRQDNRSLQWLVRLRVEKLPSFRGLRRLMRAAVDALLPAPAQPSGGKRDQPQRQGSGRTTAPTTTTTTRGRTGSGHSGGRADAGEGGGGGSSSGGGGGGGSNSNSKPSVELQFLGREPEGEQDRSVLRHVALHLLSCRVKDVGVFNDTLEGAAESLPTNLAHLYGKSRLQDFKQLLKSHPFFWVSPKSAYGSDGLTSTLQDCVALHTNTLLQFQYRARLVLEQEQQQQQQAKRRKGSSGAASAVVRGSGDAADSSGALEQWWLDLRRKRPKLNVD